MIGIGNWLQSIIVTLLFAICLDFLLPSNQLSRYVKMVMGLFILLLFLSPLFSFIEANANPDALLQAIEQQWNQVVKQTTDSHPAGNSSQSLDQIRQQSEKIQMKYHAQAIYHTEQQIALEMKRNLAAKLPFSIENIQVQLSETSSNQAEIIHVSISLRPIQNKPEHPLITTEISKYDSISAMEPIAPVKPILVQGSKSSSEDIPLPATHETDKRNGFEQAKQTCFQILRDTWMMDSSRITIHLVPEKLSQEVIP